MAGVCGMEKITHLQYWHLYSESCKTILFLQLIANSLQFSLLIQFSYLNETDCIPGALMCKSYAAVMTPAPPP